VFIESGNEKYPGANRRGVYQYGNGNPEHSIHVFLLKSFTESIAGTVPYGFTRLLAGIRAETELKLLMRGTAVRNNTQPLSKLTNMVIVGPRQGTGIADARKFLYF
jgi:hypothetical protein